jgi:Alpha/beta hydrolase domain containing 18
MTGQDNETAIAHRLDRAIAWWSRDSRLFSRGWGDDAVLREFSDRRRYFAQPRPTAIEWKLPSHRGKQASRDGTFRSPLAALPGAAAIAHVREWSRPGNEAGCVVLAASRDEGYWIREQVFLPLSARGIDLFLLESPFYGLRRDGRGPSEITVADHGMMALAMVLEARALLDYLRSRYRKLAVAGYSMGGHMAALTAAVSPLPVACAALATGGSASAIYTRGLLSWSVDFETLGGVTARERLRSLFDTADITSFRPPVRVDAAVVSGCTQDGYVLRSEIERLHRHWKGSELRWIEAGHFSALFTQRRALQQCVEAAVAKL